MKNMLFGLLLVACTSLCEGEVLRYSDLSVEKLETLRNMDVVIYLEEGEEIPVSFTTEGIVMIAGGESTMSLKLEQALYIKFDGQTEPLFSTDMDVWKPFSEMFTGSINAETKSDEGVPGFHFHLDLSVRE